MSNTPQQHDELIQEVLMRIEREEVTPTPKTLFTFKNLFFWALWGGSVFLGAIAISVVIFTELNIGWEFYELTHANPLTFFVNSIPYVWVVMLALVVLLGIYNLRHTKTGYRYSLITIILIGLGGSVLGGFFLHSYGLGSLTDETLGTFMPNYMPLQHAREGFWQQPERGLYAGTIETIDNELKQVTLRTSDDVVLTFSTKFVPLVQLERLSENVRVHLVSTTSSEEGGIILCNIAPWEKNTVRTLSDMQSRRQLHRENFETLQDELSESRNNENPCTPLPMPRRGMMLE